MGPTGVDWLPGLAALVLGLAAGAFLAWRARRAGPRTVAAGVAPPPVEVRDLTERRDALLQQLRELDDTAAKRTPEQLARERYALELDTARVLQKLESTPVLAAAAPGSAASAPVVAPVSGPLAGSPALRGFLWGTASMGGLALLLFLVFQAATPRKEGEGITGTTPTFGGSAGAPAEPGAPGAPADPEEAALRAAIAKDPEDLDTRLDLARVFLGRQDMMGVWEQTQAVLEKAPGHPRALSYQALVRLAMGQSQVALDMLRQAVKSAPDLLEPHLHLALVQLRLGQGKEADATMAEAQRRFPEQAPMLKRLMAEMRQRAAQEGEAPQFDGDPHAGVGSPGGRADAAAAEPAAPAGSGVAGVLDLDAGLAGQVPAGSLVFVTVRAAGVESGPPVAVKRLSPDSFPVRFAIGPGDSMMGVELPARLRIEARVDPDGNPLTRSPSDPSARLDGVASGTKDLRLVLRR
jgi:cytochrome c-type biogenesis protein CcmH